MTPTDDDTTTCEFLDDFGDIFADESQDYDSWRDEKFAEHEDWYRGDR